MEVTAPKQANSARQAPAASDRKPVNETKEVSCTSALAAAQPVLLACLLTCFCCFVAGCAPEPPPTTPQFDPTPSISSFACMLPFGCCAPRRYGPWPRTAPLAPRNARSLAELELRSLGGKGACSVGTLSELDMCCFRMRSHFVNGRPRAELGPPKVHAFGVLDRLWREQERGRLRLCFRSRKTTVRWQPPFCRSLTTHLRCRLVGPVAELNGR